MKIKQIFTNKDDGNIAYHVSNNVEEVNQNRRTLAQKYGFDASTMRYMEQTHGNNVHIVTQESPMLIKDCDALITTLPNITLMVMVADCIPILLKDEKKGVIAAIHAGRNSTFLQIAHKTASVMIEQLGCLPQDISATLGPSIQSCCYEVSPELANIVIQSFGKAFVKGRNIDLQGINTMQLSCLGITQITQSPICTKCSNANFYSYRLNKECGRFAGLITIEE